MNSSKVQFECPTYPSWCEGPTGRAEYRCVQCGITRLRTALERIERWFGEFPPTGRYWEPGGREMSYGAAFGSNGERDYMRQVAREALAGEPQCRDTRFVKYDAAGKPYCGACGGSKSESETLPAQTPVWQSVETFDFVDGFANSQWVLVHTSDGRVTEGLPMVIDGGKRLWLCACGNNAFDPRFKPSPCLLRDSVTHWMPKPEPPRIEVEKVSTEVPE